MPRHILWATRDYVLEDDGAGHIDLWHTPPADEWQLMDPHALAVADVQRMGADYAGLVVAAAAVGLVVAPEVPRDTISRARRMDDLDHAGWR